MKTLLLLFLFQTLSYCQIIKNDPSLYNGLNIYIQDQITQEKFTINYQVNAEKTYSGSIRYTNNNKNNFVVIDKNVLDQIHKKLFNLIAEFNLEQVNNRVNHRDGMPHLLFIEIMSNETGVTFYYSHSDKKRFDTAREFCESLKKLVHEKNSSATEK